MNRRRVAMAHKKLCKTLKILAGAAGIAFVGMQLVAKKKRLTIHTRMNQKNRIRLKARRLFL